MEENKQPTQEKVEKSKVVEVKAKDVAKTKKKDKVKKPSKVAKALKETGNELKKVSDYIEGLEKKSADGEKYRLSLCAKIKPGFAVSFPEIKEDLKEIPYQQDPRCAC